MNYLILGASSGLGKDLAYVFAKNLHNLILISRDDRDLAPIKSDYSGHSDTARPEERYHYGHY